MVIFTLILVVASYFEIKDMKKKKYSKEVYVFVVFTIITLIYGFIYFSNQNIKSLSEIALDLLGLSYNGKEG